MTRRQCLAGVFGVLAGAARGAGGLVVGARPIPRARSAPYGYLDVHGHCAHQAKTGEFLHVWYNGSNVTRQCTEADDIAGYVVLICRDTTNHRDWTRIGAYHLKNDGGSVCRLRLRGRVVIGPGTDLYPHVAIGPAQHTRWSASDARRFARRFVSNECELSAGSPGYAWRKAGDRSNGGSAQWAG